MAILDMSDSNSILSNVLIIAVVIGIAYLVFNMYGRRHHHHHHDDRNTKYIVVKDKKEHYEDIDPSMKNVNGKMEGQPSGLENPMMKKKMYNQEDENDLVGETKMEHFSQNPNNEVQRNLTSFPKDQLTADELLPQDNSSLWAQVNPSGVGSLKDRSFLQAGYNIGINTVGQTLRNANLQLRSEPPCPQVSVSPWLQSTIQSDTSRKPFEIGGCA